MLIKLIPVESIKSSNEYQIYYRAKVKDSIRHYYTSSPVRCKAKTLLGAKREATRVVDKIVRAEPQLDETSQVSLFITQRVDKDQPYKYKTVSRKLYLYGKSSWEDC